MKITKSELREMIRECLKEELAAAGLNEGIFGKKKVEPMNSTKGQKNAMAIIKKLSVDLQSDPNWDKQLIEYDYTLGTNEFLSYGLEPSEERVIGILCVEDGADLNSKSPISISPRNNRARIANTVLQALENTQIASTQHLSFSLRKDAEVAANRNALFIEIVQNER